MSDDTMIPFADLRPGDRFTIGSNYVGFETWWVESRHENGNIKAYHNGFGATFAGGYTLPRSSVRFSESRGKGEA